MRTVATTFGCLFVGLAISSGSAVAQNAEQGLAPIRAVMDSLVQTVPEGQHVLLSSDLLRPSGFGLMRLRQDMVSAFARERGLVERTTAPVCPPCVPEGASAAFWLSEPRTDPEGNTIVDVAVHTYAENENHRWPVYYGMRYVLAQRDDRWVILRAYIVFES